MKPKISSTKAKYVVIILLVTVLVITYVLILTSKNSNSNELSDYDIRNMFSCNRITLDIGATDLYCKSPDTYRHDLKDNSVISRSDFNDLRYKAMMGDGAL